MDSFADVLNLRCRDEHASLPGAALTGGVALQSSVTHNYRVQVGISTGRCSIDELGHTTHMHILCEHKHIQTLCRHTIQ